MSALKPKSEIPQPENNVSTTVDASTDSDDPAVAAESLPKVVVCFDLNTLSHRKLKAIASDIKLPGYSRMTKAELCEALLGL